MLLKTYVMLSFSLVNYWNIVVALPAIPPEQYKETRFELESCTTPSQEKGWCLPINMCLHLYKVVVTKPISQSNFELLVKSKCGFMATVPKVCCKDYPHPNFGFPPRETTTRTTTISPMVPTEPTTIQPKTTIPPQASQLQVSENDLNERVNQKPTINLLAKIEECEIETVDKIFRGEVPDAVEYAFMALLEFTNDVGQRARCSGVLINNRHVLTSARCVTIPGNWTLNHVRLGEYNTATELDCFQYAFGRECLEMLTVAVDNVTVHEQYDRADPNQYHDIALVKLAREVKYTPFIRPICIATSQQEQIDMEKTTVPGERYKMIGWNSTDNNLVKRVKNVSVRNNAECEAKYAKQLGKDQLCAQSDKSNYPKDLKSPVLATVLHHKNRKIGWYLGGLSTFPANPENGALRIYTKPTSYADWIIDKVHQSLQ